MITVCSVTGVDLQGHLESIQKTQDAIPHYTAHLIRFVPGMTREEYSKFIVQRLSELIQTEYVLICQADGFGRHKHLWTDEFLEFDYVGAPWENSEVGNGGLSLRSKRFLEASLLQGEPDLPEDSFLCQYRRKQMMAMGIRFAPLEIAQRFSYEHPVAGHPWNQQDSWGTHGKWNL